MCVNKYDASDENSWYRMLLILGPLKIIPALKFAHKGILRERHILPFQTSLCLIHIGVRPFKEKNYGTATSYSVYDAIMKLEFILTKHPWSRTEYHVFLSCSIILLLLSFISYFLQQSAEILHAHTHTHTHTYIHTHTHTHTHTQSKRLSLVFPISHP
jgi:hypothetical protein